MTPCSIPYGDILVKSAGWETPADFRCRKPEFAAYLDANAAYDQRQRMGKMYWVIHNKRTAGYMVLTMDSMGREKQSLLGIDSYGNIPALLVASLATDARYERRGIATSLLSHATKIADGLASKVGCRVVLCNAEHDVVEFYERRGFVKISEDADYVPMYFDLGAASDTAIA